MGDYRGCVIADFDQSHGGQYREESLNLRPEIEANARLIAVAPEMLEALEQITNAWREEDATFYDFNQLMRSKWMPIVRTLVRKARGE